MNILGPAECGIDAATRWAINEGATSTFIFAAETYWRYAPERGVRPEVAYAQAAKETGFGWYGGTVSPEAHNWCGLKTEKGGANDDPEAHAEFPTDEVGIIAHIDHLALYAGAPGYPRECSPDPRHFPWILGDATTVGGLSGKWAPSDTYAESIERMVKEMTG